MQAYFEPEQAFPISMPRPVFEISIAYKKRKETCRKFKEKLTCSFKHDIRNLMNVHPTIQKSENSFLSKV